MSLRYTDWRAVKVIHGPKHTAHLQTNSKGHWRAYRAPPGPDGIYPTILKRGVEARDEVRRWAALVVGEVLKETPADWPYCGIMWPARIRRSHKLGDALP
jgi:hypothetical protein